MTPLETLRFPFLGSREDGEPFEYLLLEISEEKATIAIFKWMMSHLNLNLNEKVDLFIPTTLIPVYKLRNNTPGIVTSLKREENNQGYLYEISFNHKKLIGIPGRASFERFADHIPVESSLIPTLIRLIKDSIILKQGINVYLKHFAPFFSRILSYSKEEYSSIKNFIFEDIHNRIILNEKSLTTLYQTIKDEVKDEKNICIILNLEDLRENIESEINLDLFFVAFAETDSRHELLNLLKESSYRDDLKMQYKYINYLIAIKNLEKRLYSNYNQIVLIYLKSI